MRQYSTNTQLLQKLGSTYIHRNPSSTRSYISPEITSASPEDHLRSEGVGDERGDAAGIGADLRGPWNLRLASRERERPKKARHSVFENSYPDM